MSWLEKFRRKLFFVKRFGPQYLGTKWFYKLQNLKQMTHWDSLSLLIRAPVFKIGLWSVAITPVFAQSYLYLAEQFDFAILQFPGQMARLFFAGLAVIFASIIFEWKFPRILRQVRRDTKNLKEPPVSPQDLIEELKDIFLDHIDILPATGEYLAVAARDKELDHENREDNGNKNSPVADWLITFEDYRSGYSIPAIRFIEGFLCDCAKGSGCDLWTRELVPGQKAPKYEKVACALRGKGSFNFYSVRVRLYGLDLTIATGNLEDVRDGDLLLNIHERTELSSYSIGHREHIGDYFQGLDSLLEKDVNSTLLSFITEQRNISKPTSRLSIVSLLCVCLLLLGWYLYVQVDTVIKALTLA